MDKSGQTLALTLTYAFIPHKLLIINKWRYGDYLACRRALHSWLRPQSALSRRAVELKFSSPAHLITFRFAEFGGGMGIISPAGELCTLGFAHNRRFRAAQSN